MYHKTYKTMQNNLKEKRVAATQPCRCRKPAGWQASPTLKKILLGFDSFVKE